MQTIKAGEAVLQYPGIDWKDSQVLLKTVQQPPRRTSGASGSGGFPIREHLATKLDRKIPSRESLPISIFQIVLR